MTNRLYEINPCPRCDGGMTNVNLSKRTDNEKWLCDLECRLCGFAVWGTDQDIEQAAEQAKLAWTKETLFSEHLDELYSSLNRTVAYAEMAKDIALDGLVLPDGTVQTLTTITERAKNLREAIKSLQERTTPDEGN